METVAYVVGFVGSTAVRFAPVFLLSVFLAAVIKALPVGEAASRWLQRREATSVLAGAGIGAFSPFCSCTVVPVVRGLVVAGAPLAGVMAFWVASPLMDPEIFLLSAGLLGWDLAVARLVAAVALSLLAGLGAIVAVRRGWMTAGPSRQEPAEGPVAEARELVGATVGGGGPVQVASVSPLSLPVADGCCKPASVDECCDAAPGAERAGLVASLRHLDWSRVRADVRRESWLLGRWMLVAFALEALILRFVPQEAMVAVLGSDAPWAVPLAALLGVPLYLDNFSALPVVAGLVEQGMAPGAAIAFLLAGPVTTIPAMTAVRAVMPGPVFRYYIGVSVLGSMAVGAVVDLVL